MASITQYAEASLMALPCCGLPRWQGLRAGGAVGRGWKCVLQSFWVAPGLTGDKDWQAPKGKACPVSFYSKDDGPCMGSWGTDWGRFCVTVTIFLIHKTKLMISLGAADWLSPSPQGLHQVRQKCRTAVLGIRARDRYVYVEHSHGQLKRLTHHSTGNCFELKSVANHSQNLGLD
jgi:hypothetical protein